MGSLWKGTARGAGRRSGKDFGTGGIGDCQTGGNKTASR